MASASKINATTAHHETKKTNDNSFTTTSVPSFIRLFVIRRILMTAHKTQEKMRNLAIMLPDKKMQDSAFDILLFLLNNGFKQYMSKFYNEEKQSNVIELIFNKIILKKFDKEYEKITRYRSICNDDHFQSLVFNMNDLMCLIFQFLKFDEKVDGDLNNCSLVNSHWLYHSWNPNSIYHIDKAEMSHLSTIDVRSSRNARVWQRLMNVKSVHVSNFRWSDLALEKLSMMRNVQHVVQLDSYPPYIFNDRLIKIIKQVWAPKILTFNVGLMCQNSSNNNTDSESNIENKDRKPTTTKTLLNPDPLRLINAIDITLKHQPTRTDDYILWSNKCEKLTLKRMRHVDEKWVSFIVDNCDCSGIKSLTIIDMKFSPKVVSKTMNILLAKLAEKFENLQYLTINLSTCEEYVLSLWKLLKPIIDKNKIKMELQLDKFGSNFNMLNKWLTNVGYNNKIDKLGLEISAFKKIGTLNQTPHKAMMDCMKNVQLLKIAVTTYWTQWADQDLCKILNDNILQQNNNKNDKFGQCLQVMQLIFQDPYDPPTIYMPIDDMIKFLNFKMLDLQKFYVIIDIVTNYGWRNDFGKKFDTFCQRIVSLIKGRAAIDIKIIFLQINDKSIFDKYYKVFLQYFNEKKLLNDYQPPICNNYCVAMVHPRMCFTFVESDNCQNSSTWDYIDSDYDDDSDYDYNDYACFQAKNADMV